MKCLIMVCGVEVVGARIQRLRLRPSTGRRAPPGAAVARQNSGPASLHGAAGTHSARLENETHLALATTGGARVRPKLVVAPATPERMPRGNSASMIDRWVRTGSQTGRSKQPNSSTDKRGGTLSEQQTEGKRDSHGSSDKSENRNSGGSSDWRRFSAAETERRRSGGEMSLAAVDSPSTPRSRGRMPSRSPAAGRTTAAWTEESLRGLSFVRATSGPAAERCAAAAAVPRSKGPQTAIEAEVNKAVAKARSLQYKLRGDTPGSARGMKNASGADDSIVAGVSTVVAAMFGGSEEKDSESWGMPGVCTSVHKSYQC